MWHCVTPGRPIPYPPNQLVHSSVGAQHVHLSSSQAHQSRVWPGWCFPVSLHNRLPNSCVGRLSISPPCWSGQLCGEARKHQLGNLHDWRVCDKDRPARHVVTSEWTSQFWRKERNSLAPVVLCFPTRHGPMNLLGFSHAMSVSKSFRNMFNNSMLRTEACGIALVTWVWPGDCLGT